MADKQSHLKTNKSQKETNTFDDYFQVDVKYLVRNYFTCADYH